MNHGGRVILCGQIADYNKDVPYPPPIPEDMKVLLQNPNISDFFCKNVFLNFAESNRREVNRT